MTARPGHFEVCRGDDGHWARYVASNKQVVFVSETYSRRANAENAILSLARTFGYDVPRLYWSGEPSEKVLLEAERASRRLPVRYVDERLGAQS